MMKLLFSPEVIMSTIPAQPVNAVTKQFVLAGKAHFTVELDADFLARNKHLKAHYTYRVSLKPASGKYKDKWFVSYLTGPDNTRSYSYMGVVDPELGEVRLTDKSKVNEKSFVFRLINRVLDLVWKDDIKPLVDQGFHLHHEGKCCRCARKLTTPDSILRGIGPECLKHMTGGNYPNISVNGQLP